MSLIQIKQLHFQYPNDQTFQLTINTLDIKQKEHIFIEGPSGSGKTTFLNLLTGLVKPNEGSIDIFSKNICQLSSKNCDKFRADHFGIIFQCFNLIPYLSVIDNITLPCFFSKKRKKSVLSKTKTLEDEAIRLCTSLDLDNNLLQKQVKHLSLGQQQRVAIARAIIGEPEIIIADEPTSSLDSKRKKHFIHLLMQEASRLNSTLLFVSHDTTLKPQFKTHYNLLDLNNLTDKTHVSN